MGQLRSLDRLRDQVSFVSRVAFRFTISVSTSLFLFTGIALAAIGITSLANLIVEGAVFAWVKKVLDYGELVAITGGLFLTIRHISEAIRELLVITRRLRKSRRAQNDE